MLLAFLMVSILSIIITGLLGYTNARKSLEKVYFDQLTAIRETKKRQIETYFNQINNQIITLSEDQMVVDAMNNFKTAFYNIENGGNIAEHRANLKDYYINDFLKKLDANVKIEGDIGQYLPKDERAVELQYHYISDNPNPTGSKDDLKKGNDGSEYSEAHAKYHPIIRNYLKRFGYYDIFLIDEKTGRIVYSVFKEVDFGTSLLTGPYNDTNFAAAFNAARDAKDKGFVKLADFEPYAPSYAEPASFIASPIFDNGKKIGVLIFQMPIDEINQVMTGNHNWRNEGLGKSGETYIVGSDYKMRNDSRFIIEEPARYIALLEKIGVDANTLNSIKHHSTSILYQGVFTDAVEDALIGNTDTKIMDDYRGIPVLSSYTPLNIYDVKWVMISEIDMDEAFSSVHKLRNKILFIMIIISGGAVLCGFLMSSLISKPILVLTKGIKDAKKGELPKEVKIAGDDEIGQLSESFNQMIGELKSSRDELISSKNYIENIIKSMIDSLLVMTPDAVIRTANKAACELLGYGADELVGLSAKNLLPIDDQIFSKTGLEELFKKEYITSAEKIFLTKERKMIPVAFSCSVMYDDNNNRAQGIVCIAQDITKRKQTEEHIRKLHRSIEQSPSVIIITNINGHIEYVNPKFTEITGYTFDEVMGKSPRILKSDQKPLEIYKELWATISAGKEWRGEFHNRKKNGEYYWESVSISPIRDSKGVITHFVKAAEDITDRKRAEEKLKLTQDQLVHAEKLGAVGRLSASIAHEFNNPICGIRNVLERILKKTAIDEYNKEFVDMAIVECNRVAGLIKDLQGFNRPSAGVLVRTNIHKAIDDILLLMRKKLETRKIALNKHYAANLPDIMAVNDQIKQVILNLLNNAEEAIPEKGGTITIETVPLEEKIEIRIKDTGQGIKEENLERVFEPFFTTKPGVKGTGLGMSISYGIIKRHGGEITVNSILETGTTFTISLPKEAAAQ